MDTDSPGAGYFLSDFALAAKLRQFQSVFIGVHLWLSQLYLYEKTNSHASWFSANLSFGRNRLVGAFLLKGAGGE